MPGWIYIPGVTLHDLYTLMWIEFVVFLQQPQLSPLLINQHFQNSNEGVHGLRP